MSNVNHTSLMFVSVVVCLYLFVQALILRMCVRCMCACLYVCRCVCLLCICVCVCVLVVYVCDCVCVCVSVRQSLSLSFLRVHTPKKATVLRAFMKKNTEEHRQRTRAAKERTGSTGSVRVCVYVCVSVCVYERRTKSVARPHLHSVLHSAVGDRHLDAWRAVHGSVCVCVCVCVCVDLSVSLLLLCLSHSLTLSLFLFCLLSEL